MESALTCSKRPDVRSSFRSGRSEEGDMKLRTKFFFILLVFSLLPLGAVAFI